MFWIAFRVFCCRFSESKIGKKSSKVSILDAINVKQRRSSATKAIYVFLRILESSHLFQIHISDHWNKTTKAFLEVKNVDFSGFFSKAKTEEWGKKNWSFFNNIGMLMLGSETYFLEVSAHVSLKVVAKGSLWDKKNPEI